VSLLSFNEGNYTILGSMNRKIARHVSARTSKFGRASLADENFTVLYFLATKALNAKALTSIIMDVFGGTASFYV
jgi:hypothetical protein